MGVTDSRAGPAPLDPRGFDDHLDRVLAILTNAKSEDNPWVSAVEISTLMRDRYGLRLHWRTAEAILKQDRTLAERRKRAGRWQFMVLASGESRVRAAGSPIVMVDPTSAIQSVLSLHTFLSALRGTVRVCDPYLDSTTLEHLDACAPTVTIRLMTKNVRDSGNLRRLFGAFATQGRALEIRVASVASLHDRYMIDDVGMLILGTSLNGFSKKQCFVVRAGQDVRGMATAAFDTNWATGVVWP